MAWPTKHVGKDGATRFYLHSSWDERGRRLPRGREHCHALGVVHPDDADRACRAWEADVERREPRLRRTAPERALKGFLDSRTAIRCSEGTVRYYRSALSAFFRDQGAKRLRDWRRSDVEAFLAKHPTWSERSVQKLVVALRTFRTWATEAGIEVHDFVGSLRARAPRRKRRDPVTPEQIRRLLAAAREMTDRRPWIELVVSIAAYTGLSRGDIRTLDWSEVDLVANRIARPREKSGTPLDVRISAGLREVLLRYRAIGGPVVRDLPESDSGFDKAIRECFALAHVPRERFQGLHSLRAAFVSAGLAEGGELVAVADVVGDDPAVVSKHYARSTSASRDAVVDAVDKAIRGA